MAEQTILSPNNTVETADLYLAAYFQSIGAEMFGCTRREGRVYFGFHSPEGKTIDVRAAWMAFNTDQATVKANTYAQAVKTLKNMVHTA